jgi:hypothetical protein
LRDRLGLTADDSLFNLTVSEDVPGGRIEHHRSLTFSPGSTRRIDRVLEAESRLVRLDGDLPAANSFHDYGPGHAHLVDPVTAAKQALNQAQQNRLAGAGQPTTPSAGQPTTPGTGQPSPQPTGTTPGQPADPVKAARAALQTAIQTALAEVGDGAHLAMADFLPTGPGSDKKGLFALEHADLFNLLCIPPYDLTQGGETILDADVDDLLLGQAAAYCASRRAMLLVDPKRAWQDKDAARDGLADRAAEIGNPRNAALFFPRLVGANPLRDNQEATFVPSGAVAGIFARTDSQRGVWKAPAGLEARLAGVARLSVPLTDAENGELNPLGINCLRTKPAAGHVVWGSRTLDGDDRLASEWKYIPVRRTALFIEESLFRGTQWVVFEPNDEPLWAQIRLNVGAFMHTLFRQGAFAGATPREAYFVKCDHETTTQDDVNRGVVNIRVGFAPLKPAEFVVLQIQQMAGQIEA